MKFTDGAWMMREGVSAYYPAEAYEIEPSAGGLTVFAPTRPIRHRGDTLGGPALTIRLSAPMPDVVCVRVTHFSGQKDPGPNFPLYTEKHGEVSVGVSDEAAALSSGQLTARILRGDSWGLEFSAGGKVITRSGRRSMAYAQVREASGIRAYMHDQLSLGVGECVYGLGERFTAFVKNGQVVEVWNKDGGTGSEQAYKNVPFYLTNRGYGVFVNSSDAVSFEVASEKVSRVQFSVPGESLEYYVIYGPTPKEILEKYTALTGRPALPPSWSFGLWLTTSFTTSYDEGSCTEIIKGMEERKLPLSVFHFDCFWMRGFHWCDFTWDPATFPDPTAMLARLKARGLKICVWINPYIAQRSALFEEGAAGGYLLRRTDGGVWQTDQWQPGMGIVDFTNPDARTWFADKLRALVAMGVDSFKTDFGERIPTEGVAWFDGSDPERMHNFYPYVYNETVFNVLRETLGDGEAAVFARSATAGCQKFPVHWGGDCESTFESMAESLRGGLSLGLCGFGFWSHDIGGFEGTPPTEVYKRWLAFGLMSSHSRLHGSGSYRVPWLFDEEAVDVLRHFTQVKCSLMPYLYAKAIEAHRTGVPMMRPMLVEFPDDPACDTLDRQYLLGDALLVAPVLSSENVVDYYVPGGRWTDFWSGRIVEGPTWVRGETHGYLSIPLLVRPNTVLPVGPETSRPDYDYTDGVELRVYALEPGAEATAVVPGSEGNPSIEVRVRREGDRVRAELSGPARNWRLLLVGESAGESPRGSTCETTPAGLRVTPEAGETSAEVVLRRS